MILSSSPNTFAKAAKESAAARAERSSGIVALNLGRYDEAAQHFEAAYTLTQDPALLFSLGQAYRLAGKQEKALAAYNSFLRASTYSPRNRSQYEMTASEIAVITSLLMMRMPVPSAATDAQIDDLMRARAAKSAPPQTLEPPPVEKEDESQGKPAQEKPALVQNLEPPKSEALSDAAVVAALKTENQPARVSLAVSEPLPPPPQDNKKAVYQRWWLWTSVAGALALGGAATWWFLRPESTTPPSTWGAQRVLP
jgi:tetratricopeptide (TPR) repeat protein